MNEKDLKKLTRYQLLELLIVQTERADKLEKKLEQAKEVIKEQEQRISGLSASSQFEKVFKASQEVADRYIQAAKIQAAEIEADANKKADEIVANAARRAMEISGE